MMKKRGFNILIIIFLSVGASQAQVDPLFFQQTHLRNLINPAATGKGGDINAALTVRRQQAGFSNVMVTNNAIQANGFVSPLNSGFGMKFVTDKIGPYKTTNIKLNYAYYVSFEDFAIFSLGMGVGVMSNSYNDRNVHEFYGYEDEDDPLIVNFENIKQNQTLPDFDFGFEFNTRNFELGGSLSHITYAQPDQKVIRPMRNWFAYSRAKLPMNRYWDFIPGVTWHFNRFQTTYEAIAGVRYNNMLFVNAAYRNPMNIGMTAGITYQGFTLIYSYDIGMNTTYNNGSHEVTILYKLEMNTSYIGNRLRFFKWKMF